MGIRQKITKDIPKAVRKHPAVSRDNGEKLLITCMSVGVGFLASHLFSKAFERATDKRPPDQPVHDDVEWKEALAWSVASGAGVGIAKLLMKRGLASNAARKIPGLRGR